MAERIVDGNYNAFGVNKINDELVFTFEGEKEDIHFILNKKQREDLNIEDLRKYKFLDEKYGISYNQLQTVLSIDGASAPFKRQLIHTKAVTKNKELWRYIQIKSFTKKKKEANMSIIKNAFAYDVLTILKEENVGWLHE